MSNKKFERKCPICGKSIFYSHRGSFIKTLNANKPCISCNNNRKNSLPEATVLSFKKMIEEGLFKKDIIKVLNITPSQYKYLISKLKLFSNSERAIKIVDKENNLAQCSICNKISGLDNFGFVVKKTGSAFYMTYCNECKYKKRNNLLNADIEKFLSTRFTNIKNASKHKNIIFSISKQDLIDQYNLQKGLCFYTNLPMTWVFGKGKQRDALSIDKIIPEKGYVKGNVVLCLNRINMAKNDLSLEEIKEWMPKWYKKIIKFLAK